MLNISDEVVANIPAPETDKPEPTKAMLAKANSVARGLLLRKRTERENELAFMKEEAPELHAFVTARLAELQQIVRPLHQQDELTEAEKNQVRSDHKDVPDDAILTLPLNTMEGFEQTIETYTHGANRLVKDSVLDAFVNDKLFQRSKAVSDIYRVGMKKHRKVSKLKRQIVALEKLIKNAATGNFSAIEVWHKKHNKKKRAK